MTIDSVYGHSALKKPKAQSTAIDGSVRNLWAISFPLMLSLLSGSLMLFFDRLFLARFSIDALNASTNASVVAAALQFAFISTASIGEIMVGRYNGAGKFSKLGRPVWQMIWFSLMTTCIFIPLGLTGDVFFSASSYAALEKEYFFWVMLFGPVFCVVSALSAFYIGRGSLKFVTITVICANIVNIVLDSALIFGVPLLLKPLGISGAAIATGLSQVLQAGVLFAVFLNKRNRLKFGTGDYRFSWASFKKCLNIGLPNALAHTIEIFAWVVFFRLMTAKGEDYLTVAAISQSIYFLFTFITEGISKGAMALAANMIGAKRWNEVWRLFASGVKFYAGIFLFLGFFLVLDSDPLVKLFYPQEQALTPSVQASVKSAMVWVWVFFLFEGLNWLIIGLLTAAGDTRFVFKVTSSTIWIFALLPIYVFVVCFGASAAVAWQLTAFYGLVTCLIFMWRFQSEKWRLEETVAYSAGDLKIGF